MTSFQLPSISKLIAAAWKHASPNYWKLAGIALVGVFLASPVSIFYFYNPDFSSPAAIQESLGRFYLILFLTIVVSVSVQLWTRLTLNRSIIQPNKVKVFQGYKESLKVLPAFLWIYILQMLISIPALLCFIIPWLILSVNVWFAGWFVTIGEARGLEALAKSRELSRGLFWKTALRCAWPFLVVILFSLVVNIYLPSKLIWDKEVTQVLGYVLNFAFAILVTPLIVQYDYELFLALKKRPVKKAIQKQIGKYKVLSIIGAVLFVLYVLLVLLIFSLMSIFSSPQSVEETVERPSYENFR